MLFFDKGSFTDLKTLTLLRIGEKEGLDLTLEAFL
jgi:hypothetical protein